MDFIASIAQILATIVVASHIFIKIYEQAQLL